MNFCLGELILKLLAPIGEWHQNVSEMTAGVLGEEWECHAAVYIDLFNTIFAVLQFNFQQNLLLCTKIIQ